MLKTAIIFDLLYLKLTYKCKNNVIKIKNIKAFKPSKNCF